MAQGDVGMNRMQEQLLALQSDNDKLQLASEASALLAAIVESSDDAIISKTLDGCIRSWNAGAERIFGYRADEAIGKPMTLIIPSELLEEERQILEKLRHGQRIRHFETERVTKDGRCLAVSLTISPIRNARGEVVAASTIARDISESKRAEQELRRSEEALREADRRKDEFLAILAHELRNPLAPIRYAVAAIRHPDLAPDKRTHAQEVIERQLEHMSRLLDDLLDVSRLAHGSLALQKRTVQLAAVIGTAIETARPALEGKGHTLVLELPKQRFELEADAVRLAQIFSNLLVNAAKYTNPGGRIELRAAREHGWIVVSIKDNGIGIAADMVPRLFTLFAQANTALERSEGGLGIGLALVRGLVNMHGGRVEARSAGLNRGSEFIVRLPAAVIALPTKAAADASGTAAAAHLRILVADDNRDAADSCATLLELAGHTVHTAYTGQHAFDLAKQFRPQAILLDIGMPELDGYEVAQKIRAEDWGRGIMLVAVTGWGQEEDKRRALTAGFDRHLTKPIDPSELESLLQNIETSDLPRE
jgi:PAS domain S-box-containing protein